MKATDLMVGDWVRLRYKEFGTSKIIVRTFQIAQIRKGSFGNIEVWSEKDNKGDIKGIEPIPLTAEILERNGFDYNDSLAEWATDSFCVEFGHEAFKEEPDHFFVWVSIGQVALNYVHELQHAFSLCGIEKEIEL